MVVGSLSFFILILTLCTIQSILGIGILVIGTPVLLIFDYQIIEIMLLLLPISIMTSIINILILQNHKLKNYNKEEKKISSDFFLICFPSIVVGLFFLKLANNYINFDILVSSIILFSLYLKSKKHYLLINIKVQKIFVSLIGILHGLTNSGGTLMSILILNKNIGKEKKSTSQIHLFYFLLASTQYLILLFMMKNINKQSFENFLYFFLLVIVSSLIGNFISKRIDNKFVSKLIDFLAVFSCLVLIVKIFFSN